LNHIVITLHCLITGMTKMANATEALQINKFEEENFDLDSLVSQLEGQLSVQLTDLDLMEEDRKMIGTPESLGKVIEETVMTHINNQIGVMASEEFIKNNHGNEFDPRNAIHIQTVENFEKGHIATHNHYRQKQLNDNYDRYKNTSHKKFRKDHVNSGMNQTLKRSGQLDREGIKTVKDGYSGRDIPTEKGHNNSAERDHVNASSRIYIDPSLQMSCTDEKLAKTINDKDNLVYTSKDRNRSKSDKDISEISDKETTKRMQKAKQTSDEMLEKKRKEGEEHLKQEGKKTQKEEIGRMASSAAKAAGAQFVMACLKDLLLEVVRKLIAWFKSTAKSIDTFLGSLKESFHSFATKLKKEFSNHLENAGSTALITIVSAIFKPVGDIFKKFGAMIKQGFKSAKEAFNYLRDPANKNKPFSIKIAQIGKIIVTGLTAAGAIALGGVIETGLNSIPILGQVLAYPIPLLGSLSSIIGLFMGALVSGIIGAILLNFIDKFIANRQKDEATKQQIAKGNEAMQTSRMLLAVREEKFKDTKTSVESSITARHQEASVMMKGALGAILENDRKIAELEDNAQKNIVVSEHEDAFNDIFNKLNGI
jgi:hypothetical protein